MTKRFLRQPAVLAISALLALSAANVFGQTVSGDVTGQVLDQMQMGIPNATVTALNEASGVKSSATAGPDGVYRFSNLPVGQYTITASAPMFASASVKDQEVVLNETVTANVMLPVGGASTTIEVTAAPPPLDTTTAQVQTTFQQTELEDLPVASLSRSGGISTNVQAAAIWNLTLLGAGVASNGGVGQGTGPTIAGQRPENNSFFLDGVENNNHESTGPLSNLPNDAVAEVSLLQNQFSAEFGGASGGVFNAVVKSGGNQLHGSMYEYFQNRNLNAVDALNWTIGQTSLPRFDNNRLGATIGGPIVKNKFFYFGNFEYNPIGTTATPGSPIDAPTAAGYALLATNPLVSQTNLGVLKQYAGVAPVANATPLTVGGATIPVGAINFPNAANFDNGYNAVVALDWNLSDSDQVRGRWIYNRITGIDANAQLPAFFLPEPNDTYAYSLSEFHSFNPTTQNEFRVSFNRNNNSVPSPSQTFPGLKVFPDLDIDDLNLVIGPGANASSPGGYVQNLFQVHEAVTKVTGHHTIKGGYDFSDTILTSYFIQRVRGEYEYNANGGGGLQRYLYDLPPDGVGEISAGNPFHPDGFLQHALWLNDDYRFRPNLTFNLGVRWEYVTTPVVSRYQSYSALANVPGGITFADPQPSPNEWSPRLGYAYSPGTSSLWSIRGGFSRSYNLVYGNLSDNAAPAYFQTTQDVPIGDNTPGFLAGGALAGIAAGQPTTVAQARAQVGSYTYGGKRPYGLTWTQGVQRRLGKDYTLEVRYTGTKGVHLWNQSRLNIAPQVTASNYIPTFFSMPSAATLAGLGKTLGQVESYIVPGGTAALPNNDMAALGFTNNIVGYAPQGYSSYNGLAVQLNKRYSNHLQFLMAYTWSHMEDDSTATNFSTYLSPRRAQDFTDLAAEWATSALDRRQRFTFTPIYDWKPFTSRNWFMKNVVGNWNISGTYTYQSPELATVQSGLDSNLNGDSAGDRAIINTAGAVGAGTGVTGYNAAGQPVAAGSASIVAYVANTPNARYVVAGTGAMADAGRNTFPLKPTDNIDMSLLKRFNVTERIRFEIGAQFFNVFNHAQYTGGYLSDIAGSTQNLSRSDLIPSNPLFGRFDQFYSSNSRVGQLSAHITF
jgi:hypothetical protein